MKKLLGLLSVLTISGTAVPTTIAASPYQKEETIKNSNINYQQINNLEKLNRTKRTSWLCTNQSTNISNVLKNKNLGIIKDNENITLIKKACEINGIGCVYFDEDSFTVSNKTNTSATITSIDNIYSCEYYSGTVIINYLIEDDLNNTNSLLSEWNENFKKWNSDVNRQIREDVPNFSNSQKRTWKDNKNFQLRSQIHSLNQNISIIMNNFYIKQLRNRVQNLENDLSNLKYKVETLSNADLTNCSNFSSLGSSAISIVPVVGSISSAILGIISAGCTIANS